jgi:hypothetical protein
MSRFKHIPTKKLIEILDSHHCTGKDGKDYGPYKDELQSILWQRLSSVDLDKMIDEHFKHEPQNDEAA